MKDWWHRRRLRTVALQMEGMTEHRLRLGQRRVSFLLRHRSNLTLVLHRGRSR